MKGFIGGSGFGRPSFTQGLERQRCDTDYGRVSFYRADNAVFIPRHGVRGDVPAHMVDHHAHIMALKDLGAEYIIGVSSVGSLKKDLLPGSLLAPDDFMYLDKPVTFFDGECYHAVPMISMSVRRIIVDYARMAGVAVREGGVYVQTNGPRLETKAEVRMLSGYADVVGMTMACEAILASELQIPYASLCTIDNFAHGLGGSLDQADIREVSMENGKTVEMVIGEILK